MTSQIAHFPEKRQFGRVNIAEPKICQVHLPQSQELWENQVVILNISLGGIYFASDKPLPLEKGDIRYLTFDTIRKDQEIYRLVFHIEVVRTKVGQNDLSQFAAALRLLSDPMYYPVNDINIRDFSLMDKTRILYQYYQLNRRVYEIIQKTPEVRTDRINKLKERIDRGLYEIPPIKLAQTVTDDLLEDNILFSQLQS